MGGTPETRYARSGPLSIAYQDVGDGVPFVWVPGFVSHVELQRELPAWHGFIERLERFTRFITFDKRGTGLSDRSLGVGTLEDRMDDIRAVYDACQLERAVVFGVSEGGPLSILFAATYPQRVSHLVIYGSYPGGGGAGIEERDAMCAAIATGWGTGFLDGSAVQHGDATSRVALARFERFSSTPTMAAELMRVNWDLDVRAVLPAVTVPTLVLHNRDDPFVPAAAGRFLAKRIPGARWVELDGDFHASWRAADYDGVVEHIEEFVTGTHAAIDIEIDRVLTTVLFSDIADSTGRAAEFGDHRWRLVLDEHDRLIRAELTRYRGREVNTTGDGFFAAFDGPGRAIRCATAMVRSVRALGLDLRVGVHTGECEIRRDDLAGIAVHIGARVAAHAQPGEVLVTRTVRDLVSGSGIEFEDRGRHRLKGIDGSWPLLAVMAGSAA